MCAEKAMVEMYSIRIDKLLKKVYPYSNTYTHGNQDSNDQPSKTRIVFCQVVEDNVTKIEGQA